MKRLLVLLFAVVLLTACSSNNTSTVKLYTAKDFGEIDKGTLIAYTNEVDIVIFQQAIDSAVQLPGIVDIASPQYLIELDEKSYYVWLDEEGGALMDTTDTHTLYKLTEQSAAALYEYVQ